MQALTGTFRCVACRTTLFSADELLGPEAHYLAFGSPVAPELILRHGDDIVCASCDALLGHLRDDGIRRYLIDTLAITFTPSD